MLAHAIIATPHKVCHTLEAGGLTSRSFLLPQEAAEAAPSAAEVAIAQEEALNSFVFNFASTSAQLQRSVAYALLGLPQVRPAGLRH